MDKTILVSVAVNATTGDVTLATNKFEKESDFDMVIDGLLDVVRSISKAKKDFNKEELPGKNG